MYPSAFREGRRPLEADIETLGVMKSRRIPAAFLLQAQKNRGIQDPTHGPARYEQMMYFMTSRVPRSIDSTKTGTAKVTPMVGTPDRTSISELGTDTWR